MSYFNFTQVHENLSAAQIIAKVAHEGLRPKVPLGCPLGTLMSECWRQEPTERPDFDSIVTVLSAMYVHHSLPQSLVICVTALLL